METLFEQIQSLHFPAPLPERLLVVEQQFDAPREDDIPAAVRRELENSGLLARISPGESVAVGVGSRGVQNIALIARAVVDRLLEAGAKPFIFPAMGSHGGATDEGQHEILAELGVTEVSSGVEIRSSMEVVQIGQIPDGPALYQDANAHAADHSLLINRVKPHTDFRSHIESGLSKMAVIGMGKQKGASTIHAYGGAGFQKFLEPAARIYEANTNLIGGIAVIENACDETAEVHGLLASEIGTQREADLLVRAKSLMASLPFPEIDVLVVRHLGKNISGTGMDTNIISRLMIPRQPESFGAVDIAIIALLDITPQSHGNAAGIGLANVMTARLLRKIDWVATYTNSITSGIFGMQRVNMPITMPDDRRALEVAMRGCARTPEETRMVFIRDTLTVDRLWVSQNMRAQVEAHPRLQIVEETPLQFDMNGLMLNPWQFTES
jgi:hypothetical protein